MAESITVSRILPADTERIYKAWLSGEEHGRMIGNSATFDDDGLFTAWDGYISGSTLERTPPTRIVQHWRTTEFPDGAPDSLLEVTLTPVEGGTELTLKHSNLPDGDGERYAKGWADNYFDPMADYFSSARSRLQDAGEAVAHAAEGAKAAVAQTAEQVGEAVSEAAEQVSDAVEHAAKQAQSEAKKVAARVQRTAKKASTQVKKATAAVKKAAGKAGKSGRKLVAKVKKAFAKKPKAAPAKKKAKGSAKKTKRAPLKSAGKKSKAPVKKKRQR